MGASIGGIPIRFKCIRCSRKITTLRKYAGKTGRCPTCRQQQTIPDRISFVCLCCHGRIRVTGKWAGRKVRCPKCSEPLRVPGDRRREPSYAEVELLESSIEEQAPLAPATPGPTRDLPRTQTQRCASPLMVQDGYTPFASSSADVAIVLNSETNLPEHVEDEPAAEPETPRRRAKLIAAAALFVGAAVPTAGFFAAPYVKALLEPSVDVQVAAVSAAVDAEADPNAAPSTTATPAAKEAATPTAPPPPPAPPAVKKDQGPDLWTGDPLKTLEALLERHINRENRFGQLAFQIAAAEYRFIHAGKTAEEHAAAHKKLQAWLKEKGRRNTYSFLTHVRPSLAQDAFVQDPAWKGNDRIAKLQVLVRHRRGGGALARELIAEHLVTKAKGLPLNRRGAAWMAALEELVAAGFDHRDARTSHQLSRFFEAAAFEFYRLDPKARAMTPVRKLKHLKALQARLVKLEPNRFGKYPSWTRTLIQHLSREALLADPAFLKSAPPARRKAIDALVASNAITKWDARRLLRQYVTLNMRVKDKAIPDALAALQREPGFAKASPTKQAEMAQAFYKTHNRRYDFSMLKTMRRVVSLGLLAGEHDPTKPLAPATEMAFWKTVSKRYGTGVYGNECSVRWDLARVALLNADPAYVQAGPLERAARIHKLKPVEWSAAGSIKRALVAFSGDRAAAGLPLAQRGWARMGECAKARRLGLRPAAALHAIVQHLLHNDAFRGGTAKERLAYLAKLEAEKRLDWGLRRTVELPYAIAFLETDGTFQAADAAAKRTFIDELDRPQKLISPFNRDDLKKHFGL